MNRLRRLPPQAGSRPVELTPADAGERFESHDSGRHRWRRWGGLALGVLALAEPRFAIVGIVIAVTITTRRLLARRREAKRRGGAIAAELPEVAALLQLAAAAGHGPHSAVELVGWLSPGPVGEALGEAARRIALGASFHDALHHSDLHQHPGWRRLSEALERAARDAATWSVELGVLVDDLHTRRMSDLEARAHRATISLLIPLVVCVLPAFVLIAIVPLVLAALADLPT